MDYLIPVLMVVAAAVFIWHKKAQKKDSKTLSGRVGGLAEHLRNIRKN